MSETRERRAGVVAGAVAGMAIALGALAGSAVPAIGAPPEPPFVISAELHDGHIVGVLADPSQSVSIKQKRNGVVIASRTVMADSGGFFMPTVKPLLADDRLVIKQGADKRTIPVPDLRLRLNAALDAAGGRVPTSDLHADLTIERRTGHFTHGSDHLPVVAHADGTFSADLSSLADLEGGDAVALSWMTARDDDFAITVTVPSVVVQVGRSSVDVYGKPGSPATITLRSAGGTIRGTATVTPAWAGQSVTGVFRKNGSKVKVRAGDRVSHSGRPGVSLKVRTPDLEVVATSNGYLSATCFPGGEFVAGEVFGAGAFSAFGSGPTGPGGSVYLANLTNGSGDLPSGTRVLLICETDKGYTQDMRATVP